MWGCHVINGVNWQWCPFHFFFFSFFLSLFTTRTFLFYIIYLFFFFFLKEMAMIYLLYLLYFAIAVTVALSLLLYTYQCELLYASGFPTGSRSVVSQLYVFLSNIYLYYYRLQDLHNLGYRIKKLY